MKHYFNGFPIVAFLAAMACCGAADALDFFNLKDGKEYISFSLPSNPKVDFGEYLTGGGFYIPDVTVYIDNRKITEGVAFYSANMDGGYRDETGRYNIFTEQLYRGLEFDPFFIPGIYDGYNMSNGQFDRLEISGIPEPATWLLTLIGFGGLGLAVRSRRRHAPSV